MNDLENLCYPIGRFTPPARSTREIRAQHIQTLRDLPELLCEAVRGLTGAQLNTPYRDGGWTGRQVVHHVADSHTNGYVRFKLALTEDWPTIKPYDQAAWAELHDSRLLPVEISLELIRGLHQRWVSVLESLSDADFEKGYVHPEHGRQNLATALALYDWHSRHHTAHIRNLRIHRGW